MYEIGSVAVADVLTARSNLETKKVAVITQEQAVDIARSNLAFTLGLDVNQPIRLKEELLTAKPVGMTYEQALRRAFDRRPDLKARRFGLEQSRRQLDETRAGMRRPTVSMNAGYSWGTQNTPFRGIEDLFLQNYSYSFGLSVSMPIFNGMRTENSIRQRKLQFQQTQDLLRRDERQVALSVKQATLNVARYIQQIDAQNEAVKAAEEDFRLAEERYNFGAGTILERLQAQERLFTAKNNYINAIYNYYQELASLEAAVGGLDPE
jgi:outer membrane protein TolC